MRPDGAKRIEIRLSGSLQNPAFSPDGKSIVFTRFRNGYNKEPADLFVYSLKNGVLRSLVSDGAANVNLPGSVWNKKSNRIVFSSSKGLHDEIYTVDPDHPSAVTKITDRNGAVAYEPSFSPDGTAIVFESHPPDIETQGVITRFRTDGSGAYVPLTPSGSDARQPNWSPAGGKILYQAYRNGQWDIWVMKEDGTEQRKVTRGEGDKTDASFSPDGKRIFYSGESDENLADLFSVGLKDGSVIRVTASKGYDGAPSVSPDGRKVLFESCETDPEHTSGTSLWILEMKKPPWKIAGVINYLLDSTASRKPPSPKDTWQWQLTGVVNTGYPVTVYEIDLFDTPVKTIDTLHGKGVYVVCYFSAGSYEEWREDAALFDPSVIGKAYDGWPGESWIDIRSENVKHIMQSRMNRAVAKSCDAVEADNVNGFEEDTGFPLTAEDQLAYNRFLAREAHGRALGIALKNDGTQASALVNVFDFAVTEQLFYYQESNLYTVFIDAGKAVFNAEYDTRYTSDQKRRKEMCRKSNRLHFRTLVLPLDLDDSFRYDCAVNEGEEETVFLPSQSSR